MQNTHYIHTCVLSLSRIETIIQNKYKLALSEEAVSKINKARHYLNTQQKENKAPIYGVNTGFGSLCNIKIDDDKLTSLQEIWLCLMPAELVIE